MKYTITWRQSKQDVINEPQSRDEISRALNVEDWKEEVKGKTGEEVLPILTKGIETIIRSWSSYETYGQPDAWKFCTEDIDFIFELAKECGKYWNCYLRIDK